MDKFLETYNPPKLSQEEAGNLNRQIPANEIEAVIKKKNLSTQKPWARQVHRRILANIQGKANPDSSQTIPKTPTRRKTPKLFL